MTVLRAHIPRNLHKIIRFDLLTKQLVEFRNGGVMYGRPPYEPAVLRGECKWEQGNALIESCTRGVRRPTRRAGPIPWAACFPSPAPKELAQVSRCIGSLVGGLGLVAYEAGVAMRIRSGEGAPIAWMHRLVSSFKRSDGFWWSVSGSSAGPETPDWPRVERDVQCRWKRSEPGSVHCLHFAYHVITSTKHSPHRPFSACRHDRPLAAGARRPRARPASPLRARFHSPYRYRQLEQIQFPQPLHARGNN